MRHLILVMIGLALVAAPVAASAQTTEVTPPVVQTLEPPVEKWTDMGPWVGATVGGAAAIIGVNAWSGGALLGPAVGPMLSGVLGGSWLGVSALTPIGAQTLFQTATLVASGVSGGVIGHWLAGY